MPPPADRSKRSFDWLVWLLLFGPAIVMLHPLFTEGASLRQPLRPTGEAAAILLVFALAVSPLRRLAPQARVVALLARHRRAIGLAAFFYASIHMVVFVLAIGRLDHILQGLAWASMWTGWLAFFLLVPLVLKSNDRARARLGAAWKMLHRLAYPTAALTLAHWLLLTRSPAEALVWFAPLVLLQAWRALMWLRSRRNRNQGEAK